MRTALSGRFRRVAQSCGVLLVLAHAGCLGLGQKYSHFSTPTPIREDKVLIIGVLGGRDAWDNKSRAVRRLALKLRDESPGDVLVETVENTRRGLALKLIRSALDQNQNGILEPAEIESARLILYGQSFGGAAVVKLARQLNEIGVPILLTVQIDSVGSGDDVIPPNVARAANLFQRNGLIIRGEPEIRALDPERTSIIGNFEFDYRESGTEMKGVPWYRRLFRNAHTKMEFDEAVWSKVEELVLAEIDRYRRSPSAEPSLPRARRSPY